jgi:hypothetical protein
MSHTTGRIVFLVVILAAFLATIPAAQELVAKPKPDDVEALINRLADLDHQDTGYSASTSGTAFLPLGQSETHTIIFGQQRGKHTPLHFAACKGMPTSSGCCSPARPIRMRWTAKSARPLRQNRSQRRLLAAIKALATSRRRLQRKPRKNDELLGTIHDPRVGSRRKGRRRLRRQRFTVTAKRGRTGASWSPKFGGGRSSPAGPGRRFAPDQ